MVNQNDNDAQCSNHDSVERFSSTEVIIREDILAKTKELSELITTSTEVEFYLKAEQQINKNNRIQELISMIKKKQKEIVAFESFQNDTMVKKIEAEIEALQDELDGIPIVNEFKQSQDDLNYLLQLIITVIRDTVSEKIALDGESPQEEPQTLELNEMD